MKKIIYVIVVVLVIVFAISATRGSDEAAPVTRTAVKGEIVSIDLEQAMADGPYVVTIVTENGGEEIIHIPSMGILLCEARDSIESISNLKVGMTVEANGALTADGTIVPCESASHYVRIVASE